ncbi:MAG: hypothetical protein IPO83_07635 [Chitinophagaceae bacterium]|nr:hypothetical protein [Chitinophagaceae bacterium]
MKQILILIGLTLSLCATGQQLTYKGEFVDTIKIISNSSYYHFDDKGTTTGVYDEYIVVFDKLKNNYILNPYRRTDYKYTFKPDTSFNKEKVLKQGEVVDGLLISNLLKQFEVSYIKPAFDNIGMSNEQFLNLTDEKHIVQVAKWHKEDWHFKKSYSTKEQNKTIFKGCQNVDSLNLYLATAFDTSGYIVVTDVDQHFDVVILTSKSKYRFEGKYPNSFKQPWYNHSTTNIHSTNSVLNLSINSALVAILPDKFSRLETLKFEALTNEYIEWYLKRRGIIF